MNLSLAPCNLSNVTSREVRAYFENSYDLYEDLFRSIKDEEAFYKYPDALRLPLIFYYGHTASVYINKLYLAGLVKERVNFEYESLFETGVDEMSWDDTENYRMGGKFTWPSVRDVQQYRDDVRDVILNLIDNRNIELTVTQDSPWWALFMGMEHERIHLETSSVLIRQLPVRYVERPPGWEYGPIEPDVPVNKNPMLKVHNAMVTLGKPRDFPSYGWDNEYGEWTVRVPEFESSKYLITNREFLAFVADRGYQKKEYWSDCGWKWLQFRKAKHPTFWVCNQGCSSGCGSDLSTYSHCNQDTDENHNGVISMETNRNHINSIRYRYRAMFDVIDMPLDWPVEVNFYEAKAYCSWKGPDYRLLTEAEHHAIRGPQISVSMGTKCDAIHDEDFKANINLKYASSTPVNWFPENEAGFHDVFGNVWSWVEDHFNGLPGFQSHYLYDDFSTPTFDGQHFAIVGGSWIATGDEASRFARYGFRPHFFQHLGFRLARSVTVNPPPVRHVSTKAFVRGLGELENLRDTPGVRENEMMVPSTNCQYIIDNEDFIRHEVLDFYTNENEDDPFINSCIDCIRQMGIQTNDALCFLCSVGWPAFKLTKHFNKVVGVDYSGRAMDIAMKLHNGQTIDIGDDIQIKIPEYVDERKLVFSQLTWLPNEIGTFDFIAVRGMHRAMNFKAWLVRLNAILNPNGLVAIEKLDGFDPDDIQSCLGERFYMVEDNDLKRGRSHSTSTFWRLIDD